MNYKIEACAPKDICPQIQEQCIDLISDGGAVERCFVKKIFRVCIKLSL